MAETLAHENNQVETTRDVLNSSGVSMGNASSIVGTAWNGKQGLIIDHWYFEPVRSEAGGSELQTSASPHLDYCLPSLQLKEEKEEGDTCKVKYVLKGIPRGMRKHEFISSPIAHFGRGYITTVRDRTYILGIQRSLPPTVSETERMFNNQSSFLHEASSTQVWTKELQPAGHVSSFASSLLLLLDESHKSTTTTHELSSSLTASLKLDTPLPQQKTQIKKEPHDDMNEENKTLRRELELARATIQELKEREEVYKEEIKEKELTIHKLQKEVQQQCMMNDKTTERMEDTLSADLMPPSLAPPSSSCAGIELLSLLSPQESDPSLRATTGSGDHSPLLDPSPASSSCSLDLLPCGLSLSSSPTESRAKQNLVLSFNADDEVFGVGWSA
jgi:hypothetical protein